MEENEKVNKEFTEKKSKKLGLIIGIIVAVLIIAVLVAMYIINNSKPENIYYSAIEKALKAEKVESKSIKIDTKTRITIEADENEEELEKLAKCVFGFGVQMDAESKKEIVDLALKYENNPEVKAQLYYNNGEMYSYLDGLFDKYIKIDLNDEQKEGLQSIFESTGSITDQEKNDKIVKLVKKELKKQLGEIKDFSQEEATIKIGDKDQKVKRTSLKLTDEQTCNIISNMYTNLIENKEFLECFDESQKDNLKKAEKAIKEIETTGKNTIKISLYTKGLLNEFVGANIEVYSASEKQTIIVTITKEDKNVYKYDISMKAMGMKANIVKGEAKLEEEKQTNGEKGKITLTAETSEAVGLGKAKLEVEYNLVYDEKIDEINTENNINIKELTQDDMIGIMKKLTQNPLFEEIFSTGLFDKSMQNDNIVSDELLDLEM